MSTKKAATPASPWIGDGFDAEQTVGGFREVYESALPRLVRLAHLITSSNSAAEDVVHDVFVAAYRRWDRIDDHHGYLYRAVVNRSRSVVRRRVLEARHPMDASTADLPPELDQVWIALSRIPVKRRTALVLRYYADLSVDEIAEVMHVRPPTVRSLIHRGHLSMRRELST
ncbi:MAG: sigma-70 family RNA polymerase sigma factor [Acidimicrobiia bacterium]